MDRQTKDMTVGLVLLGIAAVLAAILVAFLQGCDPGTGQPGDDTADPDECYSDDCDMECPPDTCADDSHLIRYDLECYGWEVDGEPICGCEETIKPCEHSPCYEGEPDYCTEA